MGTRADFYVASGDPMNLNLEYLGTISSDGREIDNVEEAKTERQFRLRCAKLFRDRQGCRFPKVNSFNTDCVFVWVPNHGIVYRTDDGGHPDNGKGTYISLAIENEWHEKGKQSSDERGNYTIPEWDDYSGFEKVATITGVRYRYPDNSNNNSGIVERLYEYED